MYLLTVILITVLTYVQSLCDVCKCYPFYSECSNLHDPPLFDDITSSYTETLVMDNILFSTQQKSNDFMGLFTNLDKLIVVNSQLDCDFIQDMYPDGMMNMTLISSCYNWNPSSHLTTYTTRISMTTNVFNENDVSSTTADNSFTLISKISTDIFTTDEWQLSMGDMTTTDSISTVSNISLSLAITCGISFLISGIMISLLITVVFRNYRLRKQRRGLPDPPVEDYQPEFEMDTELGGSISAINNAYSFHDPGRRNSESGSDE